MTNLERHKEIVKQMLDESNCYLCDYIPNIKEYKDCIGCPFRDGKSDIYECDYQKFIDWLLEERKEPIKLKQWEKDLLTVFMEFAGIHGEHITLNNALLISSMLREGHFKGVTDTSMKIYEIIENCEVVQ